MRAAAGEQSGIVDGGAVRRALDAEVRRARAARPDGRPRVVDVGGGTGSWAVPLAGEGCAVTVVDISPNALAALERRAREAGVHDLVTPVQGDADQLPDVVGGLVGAGGADLVLGHGLLEVVDDPARTVAALAAVAAPGAAVSVLATSRHAAFLWHVLAGRLEEARAVLTDPAGRYGPDDVVRRRLDGPEITRLLEGTGALRVELVQGDGVLEAWLPHGVREAGPAAARGAAELEDLAAGVPALREVAARLHVVARALGR